MQFHTTATTRLVGQPKGNPPCLKQPRQMIVNFRGDDTLNATPHDQN